MNSIVNRLRLSRLTPVLRKINALKGQMRSLSDNELHGVTRALKEKLDEGASDRDILPEAFAAMRENMKRKIGIFLFDVQVLGALALYDGMIAEMKTGEGKTFTAVLPIYLQFLTGKRTILVTPNSYLAARDANLLRDVYESMGMTLAVGIFDETGKKKSRRNKNTAKKNVEKKKAVYASDVVYTTCGNLGFDYLIENLSVRWEDRYMQPFECVIIDEIDAVLLDSAQMPLVISGAPRVQSNLYHSTDYFVRTLRQDTDFEVEDNDTWLTDKGIAKAEKFFTIPDLYDGKHYDFIRHIILALRAHYILESEKEYVVEDDKVKLLDANTGRILENTKMQGGQHQAIEAKENVRITDVTRAMASITYQDLFHMFPKIAGMSGTATVDADEFGEIYGVAVVGIPTNKKVIRKDLPARIFATIDAELEAAIDWILKIHETGQPVLVITASITLSEIVSELLYEMEIPHNLLNAHTAAKEAEMIAEAGQKSAVTVATSMAGRGTDILLGEGVTALGGLAVAGVGEMESRRLELQARGRAGRQGDPGISCFFLSLEDEVVRPTLKKKHLRLIGRNRELKSWSVKRAVRAAQKASDERGRASRKTTMIFGESVRQQRELVYKARRDIQQQIVKDSAYCLEQEKEIIHKFVADTEDSLSAALVTRFILDNITYRLDSFPDEAQVADPDCAERYLTDLAERKLAEKEQLLSQKNAWEQYLQVMMLKAIDESWIEEVDYLQQLKQAVVGRKYTQRNMAFEYHEDAYKAYGRMRDRIRFKMLRNILLGEVQWTKDNELKVVMP